MIGNCKPSDFFSFHFSSAFSVAACLFPLLLLLLLSHSVVLLRAAWRTPLPNDKSRPDRNAHVLFHAVRNEVKTIRGRIYPAFLPLAWEVSA
jgi:hypothetical protein